MHSPLRVAIAEDEPLVALALRCAVESWGHSVIGIARNGLEALALCRREHPDLLLMDVQMPELDGLAATRALMEECPLPVVIVTGSAGTEERAEAAGAMACVGKPLGAGDIPSLVATACTRFAEFMAARAEQRNSPEMATVGPLPTAGAEWWPAFAPRC